MRACDRILEKKWGVFTHYLEFNVNRAENPQNQGVGVTSWNDCVNAVDVKKLTDSVAATGAGYFVITMQQGNRFMLAPNAAYDEIAGTKPGEACPERDVVMELSDELEARGIDLFLYFTGDGPDDDPEIGPKFGAFVDNEPKYKQITMSFVEKWSRVLREYSLRYGERVKGWWIDGCYRELFGYNDRLLKPLYEAAKAGNPDSLVAMNDGVWWEHRKNYPEEEMVCGEFDNFNVLPKSRFIKGAQAFNLSPLGKVWAEESVRYSPEYLYHFISCANEIGGVVTVEVVICRDGSIWPEQLDTLKKVGQLMKG